MFAIHGRASDAIALIEPFMARAADAADSSEVLHVAAVLARAYVFADDYAAAFRTVDRVLAGAERIDDVALVADAVITKGTALMYSSRYRESLVLLAGGLQLAEAHGLVYPEMRARLNTSFIQVVDDPRRALATARAGLDRARRLGLRDWTFLQASNFVAAAFAIGDWDEVLAIADEPAAKEYPLTTDVLEIIGIPMAIHAFRGAVELVADASSRIQVAMAGATASQEQTIADEIAMFVELAAGQLDAVLAHDLSRAELVYGFQCHMLAGHAAVWAGNVERAREALERMSEMRPAGRWAAATRLALEAGVAALEGRRAQAESGYREALESLRELGVARDVALVLMDRAAAGPDAAVAKAAADEARAIWQRLGATALLDRLDEIASARDDAGARTNAGAEAAERTVPV
jgi:hypothetical protein